MRKKLTALAMATALIVGSAFSSFATGSPTTVTVTADTVTVTDANGDTVEVYDSEEAALEALAEAEAAGEEAAVLVVAECEETVDTSDEEVAAVVEDAIAAILADNSASEAIINAETGETITAEEAVVIGTAEFTVVSVNGGDIVWPVTIDFEAPGVTAKNFIAILHRPEEGTNAGKWVNQNGSVPQDGVIRATFENLSPVAFVVNATATEDETTTVASGSEGSTTVSGNTSSLTGDISLALPIALLVIAGAAIVVLVAKGRKKETE